jgi:hypothetical protein
VFFVDLAFLVITQQLTNVVGHGDVLDG